MLLVPLMESSEFSNSSDVRPALSALLKMTSEPKSLEIRKASKKAIVSLFELNAASMSLMLRQQPQPLQVTVATEVQWLLSCNDYRMQQTKY